MKPPNGSVSPAGSAGSPASTSIAGAGVAASGETGTAAPESSGKVISMSVLLGGGGGAEKGGEREQQFLVVLWESPQWEQ